MRIDGKINSELRHTPEKGLEAWDSMWFKAIVEGGSNLRTCITFGENDFYRGDKIFYWEGEIRKFNFLLDQAYLEYTGPLVQDGSTVFLKVGDIGFSYHPYFLKLDYWNNGEYLERYYDRSKRGILLDQVRCGGFELGGFYLWDGGKPWQYAFGGKGIKQSPKANLGVYLVSYNDDKIESNREGNVTYLNIPRLKQDALGLEVGYSLGFLTMKGVMGYLNVNEGSLQQDSVRINTYNSRLIDFQTVYKIAPNLSLTARFLDFPKEFDPIYRDRTPKHDEKTNQILPWNMLDRYHDQKGIEINVTHQEDNHKIAVSLKRMKDHNREFPEMTNGFIFDGKRQLGKKSEVGLWQRVEIKKVKRANLTWNDILYTSSKLIISHTLNSGLKVNYRIAQRDSIEEKDNLQEVFINNQIATGLLKGFNYEMGLKYSTITAKGYPFLSLNCKSPAGIQFTLKYSQINRVEHEEYEYDEDELSIYIDNIISARFETTF